jgi:DNA-binding LacI/PurR family transcriptional regulator
MHSIPKSKSGQLSDLLRDRLAAGTLGQKLPSERSLAEEFLVSRTTLRQALAMLTKEQWIERSTSTRGGRSLKRTTENTSPCKPRQVVVLTLLLQSSPLLHEQLASLREMLGHARLPVHVQEAGSLIERMAPDTSLRRIVNRHRDSIWILHKMPEAVQKWFACSELPTVIFGSAFPGIDLPSIDIDYRAVARHAAGLCLARGCRQISILVHRTTLAGDTRTVDAVTAQLALNGVPPPQVMHYDFNRLRLMDALDREIVARLDSRDALIVSNHHHLMTALPHLLRRGVRIPDDLSLVYLSNDLSAERLSPLPYRYDVGSAHIRRLVQAVKALADGEMPASSLLIPKLLKGETLSPPC